MSVVTIPVRSDFNAYRMQVTLDSVVFTLVFKQNLRNATWTMDVLQQDETPIRHGIKVVTAFPLLRLIQQLARPDGELVAIDTTGQDLLANLEQLGTEVVLTYVDAESIAAL